MAFFKSSTMFVVALVGLLVTFVHGVPLQVPNIDEGIHCFFDLKPFCRTVHPARLMVPTTKVLTHFPVVTPKLPAYLLVPPTKLPTTVHKREEEVHCRHWPFCYPQVPSQYHTTVITYPTDELLAVRSPDEEVMPEVTPTPPADPTSSHKPTSTLSTHHARSTFLTRPHSPTPVANPTYGYHPISTLSTHHTRSTLPTRSDGDHTRTTLTSHRLHPPPVASQPPKDDLTHKCNGEPCAAVAHHSYYPVSTPCTTEFFVDRPFFNFNGVSTKYAATTTATSHVPCGGCDLEIITRIGPFIGGGHGPVVHFTTTVTVMQTTTMNVVQCSA